MRWGRPRSCSACSRRRRSSCAGRSPRESSTRAVFASSIRAASPFTSETVMAAIAACSLAGARVVVQRYGEANRRLCEALTGRGAAVQEIATYRWALPADTGPLERLIDALARSAVDAVVFTSAVQVKPSLRSPPRGAGLPSCPRCCAAHHCLDRTGVLAGARGARHHTHIRGRSAQARAADCASEGGARHIAASRLPVSGSRRQRNSPDSYAGPPFRTIRRNTPMV